MTRDTSVASKSRASSPFKSPLRETCDTNFASSPSSLSLPAAAAQISESTTKEQQHQQRSPNSFHEPWISCIDVNAVDFSAKSLAVLFLEVEKLTMKLMVSESENVALRTEFNRQQHIQDNVSQLHQLHRAEEEQNISTSMEVRLNELRRQIEVERNVLVDLKTAVKGERKKFAERESLNAAVRGEALGMQSMSLSFLNISHLFCIGKVF